MHAVREAIRRTFPWALAVVASLWLAGASAQQHPEMAGPFVPTPPAVAAAMLELAGVTEHDTVVDLGSGDGRIVIEAAQRYGARGLGVDISPGLVRLANENARKAGVDNRVKFFVGDLFKATLSQATVVFVYLLPKSVARLVPKLYEELAPGTRVVSHDYKLEPLRAEKRKELQVPEKAKITGTAQTFLYLYVIAAPVQGRWAMILPSSLGGRAIFVFEQQFDHVSGYVEGDGARVPLTDAAITGRKLHFVVPVLGSHKDVPFTLTARDADLEGVATVGSIDLQVTGFRDTRPPVN